MDHGRVVNNGMVHVSASVVDRVTVVGDRRFLRRHGLNHWHGVNNRGVNKGGAAVVHNVAILRDGWLGQWYGVNCVYHGAFVNIVAGESGGAGQDGGENYLGKKKKYWFGR